jgi:hypothetical protein
VQKKIQRTIAEMRRRHAPQEQFVHLFAVLHDALTDLERRTLPAAEEDAAAEADRARPRINREGGRFMDRLEAPPSAATSPAGAR